MKKMLSLLLSIIIIFSFITEIPVFAATSDSLNYNEIMEPINFTDENGNVYIVNINVDVKEKKILFIFPVNYISSFSIEAIKTTNNGLESVYTYKSKEYKYWWSSPKTIEKAFKKEKLKNIYNSLYDFQTVCKMYEKYNSEPESTNNTEEIIKELISDYTKCVEDKIKSVQPNESDVAVELASATLGSIYDHFGIGDIAKLEYIDDFYADLKEYSALANEMCEKIWESINYWEAFLSSHLQSNIDVNAEINALKDYKAKELFELIGAEAEKENSKFKKESTTYKKYTTQFAKSNHITAPTFEFAYPNNWEIKEEIVNENEYIQEQIELTNSNLKITYISLPRPLGGYGRKWIKAEAVEVAKSSFMPGYVQGTDYSSLGEFVVAKIHETGFMMLDVDTDFQKTDNYYYAVIPKSYLGEMEYADRLDGIGFNYGGKYHQYLFYAEIDSNKFTSEEEQEIIKILSSFKESL